MMTEFRKSPATYVILAANVLMFVLVELTGGSNDLENMIRWGAQYLPLVVGEGQYYRLFTCMFLHFGLAHLINNMVIFYFVGGPLERAVGTVRFLVIYLLAGFGANCVSCYLDFISQSSPVAAGASGAVFAAIGAMIWALIINHGRVENLTTGRMIFMALLTLYYGFIAAGVDNAAHIAGFIFGFVLAMILYHHPKRRNTQNQQRIA